MIELFPLQFRIAHEFEVRIPDRRWILRDILPYHPKPLIALRSRIACLADVCAQVSIAREPKCAADHVDAQVNADLLVGQEIGARKAVLRWRNFSLVFDNRNSRIGVDLHVAECASAIAFAAFAFSILDAVYKARFARAHGRYKERHMGVGVVSAKGDWLMVNDVDNVFGNGGKFGDSLIGFPLLGSPRENSCE
ncbi:MAG: hypothetical protein WBY94_04595 [Polyangiaceae bacterium]